MWYFAWVLGLGFAVLLAVLNAMWGEFEEERAQRSQEQDEKRKASQAIQQQSKVPASMQEYIKKREANIDEFRPVYPALTPYYKRLVEQYYNQLSGK